jgi:hypothetical protein
MGRALDKLPVKAQELIRHPVQRSASVRTTVYIAVYLFAEANYEDIEQASR